MHDLGGLSGWQGVDEVGGLGSVKASSKGSGCPPRVGRRCEVPLEQARATYEGKAHRVAGGRGGHKYGSTGGESHLHD